MSSRKLKIRDLTMRDGQQSLFATRMSQSTIDRLLPLYENAGFYIMEVWGGAVPDSVMRYLDESPWNRLRKASEAMKGKSLLSALSRGRNLFGYVPYPDSVLEGFYKEAIKNGLNVMRIFDALNDPIMGVIVDNTKTRFGKFKPWIALGALVSGMLTVLLFTDFGLQGAGYIAVFALIYIAWGLAYTCLLYTSDAADEL